MSSLDSDTFAALYHDHRGWLRGWLYKRLECAELAADLAQDTFVRLLSSSSPKQFDSVAGARLAARHGQKPVHYALAAAGNRAGLAGDAGGPARAVRALGRAPGDSVAGIAGDQRAPAQAAGRDRAGLYAGPCLPNDRRSRRAGAWHLRAHGQKACGQGHAGLLEAQRRHTAHALQTGLSYRFVDAGAVTLEPDQAEAAPEPLPPLSVEGEADEAGPRPSGGADSAYRVKDANINVLGKKPIKDTPYSVAVYSSELMKNKQARSLADITKGDASVSLMADNLVRENNTPAIRGIRPDLTNGYKIDGINARVRSSDLPLEHLERIEILKGASGFLYGFGAKAEGDDWSASAALFRIERGLTYTTANNVFTQDGEARYQGMELNGKFRLSSRWLLTASAMWLDATNQKTTGGALDGKRIGAVAREQVSLYSEYRMAEFPLTLTAGARYVSKRPLDSGNQFYVGDVTLFDIGMRYAMETVGQKKLILRLNVDNLTDEAYWLRRAGTTILYQGPPLTIKLGAQFEF